MRNESKAEKLGRNLALGWEALSTDRSLAEDLSMSHICWDPKDGDLCLNRVKPGETLVEARSDTDVQIVRLIWV
jgi:hypothetical protein